MTRTNPWSRLGLAATGFALVVLPFVHQSAGAAASATDAQVDRGRKLFNDWSCSSCHALSDAGADGHVGPALDGDASLTKQLVIDRITNGSGPMPSFGGQMSDEEIGALADYVVKVAKK